MAFFKKFLGENFSSCSTSMNSYMLMTILFTYVFVYSRLTRLNSDKNRTFRQKKNKKRRSARSISSVPYRTKQPNAERVYDYTLQPCPSPSLNNANRLKVKRDYCKIGLKHE